jgi:hypothetical protein
MVIIFGGNESCLPGLGNSMQDRVPSLDVHRLKVNVPEICVKKLGDSRGMVKNLETLNLD